MPSNLIATASKTKTTASSKLKVRESMQISSQGLTAFGLHAGGATAIKQKGGGVTGTTTSGGDLRKSLVNPSLLSRLLDFK